MKNAFALLTALTLLLGSTSAFASGEGGGWTSGGGDPLRIAFEEGQVLAAEILLRTEEAPFPSNIRPEVAAWVLANRRAMIDDLRATKLDWTIDPIEEQPTCAVTRFSRAASIQLSLLSCRSITSKEEAAKLLLHETTHHLGNADETLADRVAVAVFSAWGAELENDVVECPTPRDQDHPMVQMVRNLPGLWHRSPEISVELGADKSDGGPKGYVRFTSELRVMRQFRERPIGRCAFAAGSMTVSNRRGTFEAPYIVGDVDGRAVLFALPNRRFGLQIVRGQTREQDLLFLTDLDTQEAVSAYAKGLREETPAPQPQPQPRPRPPHRP